MVTIKLVLTNEEAVTLENALHRHGMAVYWQGEAVRNNKQRDRGTWLRILGDRVRGQRRTQQNLEGG